MTIQTRVGRILEEVNVRREYKVVVHIVEVK